MRAGEGWWGVVRAVGKRGCRALDRWTGEVGGGAVWRGVGYYAGAEAPRIVPLGRPLALALHWGGRGWRRR